MTIIICHKCDHHNQWTNINMQSNCAKCGCKLTKTGLEAEKTTSYNKDLHHTIIQYPKENSMKEELPATIPCESTYKDKVATMETATQATMEEEQRLSQQQLTNLYENNDLIFKMNKLKEDVYAISPIEPYVSNIIKEIDKFITFAIK